MPRRYVPRAYPLNRYRTEEPAFYSVVLERRCLLRKRGLQTLPAPAAAARPWPFDIAQRP